MTRRQFIKASVLTGAAVGLGGGALWLSAEVDKSRLTIDGVLATIDVLEKQSLTTTGAWSLNQILDHCAQSVEYSISGFPEHKSAVFKYTVGKLAFAAFSTKGKMLHALDEVIPGAPLIKLVPIAPLSMALAFIRLRHSLAAFQQYHGDFAPHFAYGALSKADYEQAHAMHFYNHLDEIQSI